MANDPYTIIDDEEEPSPAVQELPGFNDQWGLLEAKLDPSLRQDSAKVSRNIQLADEVGLPVDLVDRNFEEVTAQKLSLIHI